MRIVGFLAWSLRKNISSSLVIATLDSNPRKKPASSDTKDPESRTLEYFCNLVLLLQLGCRCKCIGGDEQKTSQYSARY